METDIAGLMKWATGMWGAEHEQARTELDSSTGALSLEERVARVEDQLEIERVFRRYHSLYDAHDIDGVLACFAPDAVQINGRGTFVGHESLRKSYEYLTGLQRAIFHYGANPHVSFDPARPGKAMLTARYFAVYASYGEYSNVHGGSYINRMVRIDGRWLIAEQRITYNWQFDVALTKRFMGTVELPPPEHPLSQFDLVEQRYILT